MVRPRSDDLLAAATLDAGQTGEHQIAVEDADQLARNLEKPLITMPRVARAVMLARAAAGR